MMVDKQSWTGGPQSRGSFDILWTCLCTLALCVWGAVHPNIQVFPTYRRSLLTRAGMMGVAIVFPEIIISSAWRQLQSSQNLHNKINTLSPIEMTQLPNGMQSSHQNQKGAVDEQDSQRELLITDPPTASLRRKPLPTPTAKSELKKKITRWNSEQAFFATMGGFSVENQYLDRANTKVTIRRLFTVDGVLQLAELGLIPTITPEDIADRSKADDVAKVFVLSQITWFGLQVIGRLASDLPVTPLELHTAVHVICAIVMYLLWIKKPYDVRNSLSLNEPGAKAIAALCNFYKITSELHAKAFTEFEAKRISYWNDRAVRAANNLLDHDAPPSPPERVSMTKLVERYLTLTEDPLTATEDDQESALMALAPSSMQGIKLLKSRGGFTEDSINTRSWNLLRENSENFAIKAVWGGWSTNTGHEMSLDKAVHFIFNFLYGGGHLAAWASSSFPTSVEQNLWRASAIMLTSIPIWGTLWILWWKAVNSKSRWLYFIRNGDLDVVVAPFFFIVMLAYFIARCYFLVESLISLRLLPAGAFLTVNWARYLPHVS